MGTYNKTNQDIIKAFQVLTDTCFLQIFNSLAAASAIFSVKPWTTFRKHTIQSAIYQFENIACLKSWPDLLRRQPIWGSFWHQQSLSVSQSCLMDPEAYIMDKVVRDEASQPQQWRRQQWRLLCSGNRWSQEAVHQDPFFGKVAAQTGIRGIKIIRRTTNYH